MSCIRPFVLLSAVLVGLGTGAVCARSAAAQTDAPQTDAPRAYWIVITGLSGEPQYAQTYDDWARRIVAAATDRFGATEVTWLAEKEGDGVTGVSTRVNIAAKVGAVAAAATDADVLFVVLIGHGSSASDAARLAIPGPDLTAADLAGWLEAVHARTTIINTASASGGWIAPLASKGRIVVTATKSGTEQNEATFGRYFADALVLDAADTDKDGRVSVLEAYEYAQREVQRAYAADKRLLTEHAMIDGNGDGTAVASAAPDSPDGAVAALTHFGVSGRRTDGGSSAAAAGSAAAARSAMPNPAQTPALRALYEEKARLEQKLADLRLRKADLPAESYQTQLEGVLLEIARNGRSIRELEGGA
jgi:hypothetical protein